MMGVSMVNLWLRILWLTIANKGASIVNLRLRISNLLLIYELSMVSNSLSIAKNG